MCNDVRAAAEEGSVTAPRQIEPSMTFFVTVRAVSRSHRFVPKPAVVESLDFVLKATAAKYQGKIALHEYEFLSNHFHLLGTDLDGCLPDFMRDLNALLSKQLNALRGTRGTNIEKDYNLVVVNITTGDKAIEHAVYTLANAVEAHLVERTPEWKAPNSYALEYGEPVLAKRPETGLWSGKVAHAQRSASKRSKRAAYAGKSNVPKQVRFELVRPPVRRDLSDKALRKHIRAEVTKVEDALVERRKHEGRQVAGWNRVVAKRYSDIAPKSEEFFGVRPTFSADDADSCAEARRHRARFLAGYRDALRAFLAGVKDVLFPFGTWLMRKRFNAPCATCAAAA